MSGKLFLILILIAMLLALAVWIICVMIRDNRRFVVREYRVRSAKLPRPMTLVFLSDMHENTYGEDNADVVKAIDKAKPDAILVGGDMIISSKAAVGEEDWYENTVSLLKKLSQKYPIIATDGNHETALRVSRHHTSCYSMLRLKYAELGIHFLDNESITLSSVLKELKETAQAYDGMQSLEDSTQQIKAKAQDSEDSVQNSEIAADGKQIIISGLCPGKRWYKKFRYRKMPAEVITEKLGEPNDSAFHILLSHHPRYFPAYVKWGADLTLSGHLHGGIARLPKIGGVISPDPAFFPKYNGGMYELPKGNASSEPSTMICSCGLGMHTLPIRVFNPAELTVVHLEPL